MVADGGNETAASTHGGGVGAAGPRGHSDSDKDTGLSLR